MRGAAKPLDLTYSAPRAIWLVFGVIVAGVLAGLAELSMPLAGMVYVLLFLPIAWVRADIALALIFASAPFQGDLSEGGGPKFSLAEVNLALTFGILVLKKLGQGRGLSLGLLTLPIIFFLIVSLGCSVMNWREASGSSLVQTGLYLVVAVAIFDSLAEVPEQFNLALNGLIVVGAILAGIVVALRSQYVLGLHKNGIGASLCCALLVNAELWFRQSDRRRRRWYTLSLMLIAAGLVVTLSRGAWLATGGGLVLIMLMRGQVGLLLRAAVMLTPVVVVLWFALPDQAKETATDLGLQRFGSLAARLESADFAWKVFQSNPIFGVGVGLRKEYDATNVVLCTMAETGVPGLIGFVSIHVALLVMVWRARNRLPRNSLAYSLLMIGAALVLSKLIHGMVDHYWGRGSATIAWAGAGMAVWASFAARDVRQPQRAEAGQHLHRSRPAASYAEPSLGNARLRQPC